MFKGFFLEIPPNGFEGFLKLDTYYASYRIFRKYAKTDQIQQEKYLMYSYFLDVFP